MGFFKKWGPEDFAKVVKERKKEAILKGYDMQKSNKIAHREGRRTR